LGSVAKLARFPLKGNGHLVAIRPGMALFSRTHINNISHKIIGAAIEVHRRLGAGMFESVYHKCMAWELRHRGVKFISEHPVPIVYKGEHLDAAFVVDPRRR
jgi:hypothetical protein